MSSPREPGDEIIREPTNSDEPASTSLRDSADSGDREPTNTEEIIREPTNEG